MDENKEIGATSFWKGKPATELTREELIEALNWCGKEIERLLEKNEHDRNYIMETFVRR